MAATDVIDQLQEPQGRSGWRARRSLPLPVSDDRLVARLRHGDERAFELIYERYHRDLLAFCRHMVGSREEAEDALQHVFVAAHKHLLADRKAIQLRPWLYAIARNRCISMLRARKQTTALDEVPEPAVAGLQLADEVQQRSDLQELLQDMARLPDDQRAALVLSELGALSHDEVAQVLGVRRDKVKALVFQAREGLQGWREARMTDCATIREQLANLRGGALRRAPLRRHLDTCRGCQEFRDEVRRQREAMAVLLPVVPSVALKAKVLGAVAASPVVPVAAGSIAAGGSASLLGGAGAKVLGAIALAGVAGGGYVVERRATPPRVAPAVSAPAVAPASAASGGTHSSVLRVSAAPKSRRPLRRAQVGDGPRGSDAKSPPRAAPKARGSRDRPAAQASPVARERSHGQRGAEQKAARPNRDHAKQARTPPGQAKPKPPVTHRPATSPKASGAQPPATPHASNGKAQGHAKGQGTTTPPAVPDGAGTGAAAVPGPARAAG